MRTRVIERARSIQVKTKFGSLLVQAANLPLSGYGWMGSRGSGGYAERVIKSDVSHPRC